MLTLRTHLIISGALLAALIGVTLLGNLLQRAGVPPLSGASRSIAVALFLFLFVAFGFSAIPVMVKLVLGAQLEVGNRDVAAVALAPRHQRAIIWSLWGLMGAGLLIGAPAAVFGGMFGAAPRRALDRALAGPHLGVLAARPDMTLAEMVRQSTVTLDLRYARSAIAGGSDGVFDFTIPGTTLTFPRSRYFFITTYRDDSARVQAVNIGISPEKLTRTGVDSADAALRARLAADGWLAGHEVDRDDEDRQLHGGATEGPEGRCWLKDGMVLGINRRRMDDERPGEDQAIAGEWIQYVELRPVKGYPGMDRLVFQPPQDTAEPGP